MRLLLIPITIMGLLSCSTDRQIHQDERRCGPDHKIEVKLMIELVMLKHHVYNSGIAIRTTLKNRTGKDIFFYQPEMQAYSDNGRLQLMPDLTPGVVPEKYRFTRDTVNNPAFELANEMIRKKPSLRDPNDLQRFIFTANVLFLKNGEEKEIIRGITGIQNFSPENFKIVTSSLMSVQDGNKILDAPPAHYQGYEFWTEPIYSDTLFLSIR